ncbi:MAG: AAA family ATPase [Piscinibacter sp.]|nr:AAA family ATPase [Piscinibacter sp.]
MQLRLSRSPGGFDAAGRPVPLGIRDAALLAWLALEGPTARTRLAELLWPGSGPEAARNALRQRLFQLKRQFGAELVIGASVLSLADGVRHDLHEADEVLGDGADGLDGELADWLARQRERRRERMRLSLVDLAEAAERASDWADALTHARELLALEPVSEEAHRRLIRLHYLAGDRAAALLAFDRCEQVLKNEVGTRPGAATLELLRTLESAAAPNLPAAAMPVPAAMLRPPRVVGRGAEIERALRAWRDGRAVLVEGEAGMGKSRLLQELAARRGDAVGVQARPGDAVVPYATLARLLRALLASAIPDAAARRALAPLLPELGLPGVASPPGMLAPAVAAVLAGAARAGTGIVLVDDLHFADEASLELLLQLARVDAPDAPGWGFARRPAEGSGALAQLHDALLEEQRLEPVVLQPLGPAQLAELLRGLDLPAAQIEPLAALLHRHTGGNPLYALETLRQAWHETGLDGVRLPSPASVTRLIERRLQRLSPAAMRLARCAALAGGDFDIELAAAVLAVPAIDLADAWRELEQAQVFADGLFAHDLIHEVLRAGVPRPIAAHLHGEVARHLEARAAAPAAVADHWLAAGQAARALPFLRLAGEGALRQRRFGEATTTFEQECRLRLAEDDAGEAFEAALRMRQASFELDLAARTDVALDLLERAARSPAQRAQAHAERAIVSVHRGAMADAERAAEAGLAALGDADEPLLRADLHQHLAAVRLWQLRAAEAGALLRSVEQDVETHGSAARRFEFAQAAGVVHEHLDRPTEAAQWQRRAVDHALAAGLLPGAAQALLNLALGWRDAGRLDEALATLIEAQALLAGLPEGAIPYSSLDTNFGIVLRDLGRYDEALRWLDQSVERGRVHMPGWVANFLCHRAQAWLVLGQPARAQQDLDAGADPAAPALARTRRQLLLAQLHIQLRQDAHPALERAAEALGTHARALLRQRYVLARCLVLDPADALAAAGGVLDEALAAQRDGLAVAARTRICQALLALGHEAEAARQARHLAGVPATGGCDELYRGEVWHTAWRALEPVDPAAAGQLLARAVAWLHTTLQQHVPEPFRAGFVERNPSNRELLACAARSGLTVA